jgi:predicted nucleic acid-binding protein
MTGVSRLYLDTNVLISAAEGVCEEATLLNALLDASIRAATPFLVTSEMSLAELLVKPLRTGNDELVGHYNILIRSGEWLDVYPVSRQVLLQSARLRALSRLKLPDAIHFATAQLSHCRHFLTADADFSDLVLRAAGEEMRSDAVITIIRPDVPTLTTLLESLSP